MKLKVLLIGNYSPDAQESMQRFARLLLGELSLQGLDVKLLCPEPCFFRLAGGRSSAHQGLGKWLGYMDKFLLFPLFLLGCVRRYDIVHICDHSNAMYGQWMLGRPWVLTCNDLLAVRSALREFPQNPTRWSGRLLQKWILSWLSRAPQVACISDATRQDVLRLTAQVSGKVSVVHMGLNHHLLGYL
jgi:hypothetical protein